VKQWGIERYKDFLITSSAVPTFAARFEWYAQGIVLRPGRLSSIVEVQSIKELCQRSPLFIVLSAFDKNAPVVI
jgi:hypothetical protein